MILSLQRFPVRAAAFLAAFALACACMIGSAPVTRTGAFCPTAPVQKVLEVQRDCCGRVIRVQKRAPRPGEREFVQCRCSEKKSADHTALVSSKDVLFLESSVLEFEASVPRDVKVIPSRFSSRLSTVSFPPDVPPPSV